MTRTPQRPGATSPGAAAHLRRPSHPRRRPPYRFTARDAELLQLVTSTPSQEDIATRLGCSVSTVERRLAAMREALGVRTTIQVVVAAVRAGAL